MQAVRVCHAGGGIAVEETSPEVAVDDLCIERELADQPPDVYCVCPGDGDEHDGHHDGPGQEEDGEDRLKEEEGPADLQGDAN